MTSECNEPRENRPDEHVQNIVAVPIVHTNHLGRYKLNRQC